MGGHGWAKVAADGCGLGMGMGTNSKEMLGSNGYAKLAFIDSNSVSRSRVILTNTELYNVV